MNPSYTVFHPDTETFSSIWTTYDKDFHGFYTAYLEDIEHYGSTTGLAPKSNEPANAFPLSSIPWVSFTSFNLNVSGGGAYLLPIFTLGKYEKQGHKTVLPLCIQVHHAVCDGYHLGRFLSEVQALALKPQSWLTLS